MHIFEGTKVYGFAVDAESQLNDFVEYRFHDAYDYHVDAPKRIIKQRLRRLLHDLLDRFRTACTVGSEQPSSGTSQFTLSHEHGTVNGDDMKSTHLIHGDEPLHHEWAT